LTTQKEADCYFGVSFCGDTTEEAELLIDRVKDYTNLFVVQSGPVSTNQTALNEICDYATKADLDIVVFFGDLATRVLEYKGLMWRVDWLSMAKQRWGNQFLGVYYYDEPGGNWLDYSNWSLIFSRISTATYDNVAGFYTDSLRNDSGYKQLEQNQIPVYTSDYMLYWFDYVMGYDVVFAQLGWNHTIAQDIALTRGAANLQNKSWGTMITWKYNHPPYLDTPENIYDQLLASYMNGADYIVLFNYPAYPEGNQYGAMTDQHFQVLEQFWNEVATNPDVVHGSNKAEAVLVLPKNYGWGMRNPEDKIWGFWEPDENSQQIWAISQQLLAQYGTKLDIIYDDPAYPLADKYAQIYMWNQTLTQNP
jgi:hypothetical protein